MSSFLTRIILMSMTLILALTLSGCATTNNVTQDYKPDTDFRPYKTFSWHNFSSDVVSADQVAIQRAVEQQLKQQGFELVSGVSDLVLDLMIIKQAAAPSSAGIGLSIGLPIGRHGAIGLGTSKLLGNDPKMDALIIVDITAQASHQILWRGTAENIPLSDFMLQNQVKLNARLRDLLQQFPPKSAK
ncbi:MAG TPA: DUF4136 domain-containing protein [Cellvibrio sp.]|nr:DUF4136 domain-containing protein [Cellvibrio sp.]